MRSRKMTDAELASIIDTQISEAVVYEGEDLSQLRRKALAYYEGDETLDSDVTPQANRSRVVSRDMSDVLGWIMPSLLRVFLAADTVAIYEPRRVEAEAGAKQATDYVNYVFLNECDGYELLYDALWDALVFGNGVIKHWWNEAPEYKIEEFSGLSELDYLNLLSDPDVDDVLEHSARPDPMASVLPGELFPGGAPMLHDVKIRRRVSHGRLCVAAVPPEEFRIDRNATRLDEEHVRFCAHVNPRATRSSLIVDGYPRDIVDSLPANVSSAASQSLQATRGQASPLRDMAPDRSTDLIEVWECYVQVDYDGDGVAEWRRVVTAAGATERVILLNEEFGDDLPFSDLVPNPMPHRWRGGSLYEEIGDIQRIKTVLWRGINDNLYWTNNPQRQALETAISPASMDKLINPKFGDVVMVTQPNAIADIPVPFIADKLLAGMDLADRVREFRTGVPAATMSLDPEALQNQTATAVNATKTASYSKVETYARNIADYGGLKRLFGCLLRLIVKHQDKARTIRLRGQWIEIDPRTWDDEMDVTINVGLGSGSRDRDLAVLQAVAAKQEQVVAALGPMIAAQLGMGPDVIFATYRRMVEAAGLKSPETYFPEITRDQVMKIVAQAVQQQNPEIQARVALLAAQAKKAQADAVTAAQKVQISAAQAQLDAQMSVFDLEHIKAEIENLRAAALANIAKAGAMQSDAQVNQQLAALDALDKLVSWHAEKQRLSSEIERMRREVETPGVATAH